MSKWLVAIECSENILLDFLMTAWQEAAYSIVKDNEKDTIPLYV
jgi:hypothetical protein